MPRGVPAGVRKSKKRKRRSFTVEFVRLVKQGDTSIGQIARELDLAETAVRDWVARADVDANPRPDGPLTTDKRDELRRLRRGVNDSRWSARS